MTIQCGICRKPGFVSDDQRRAMGDGGSTGPLLARGVRFYCTSGHVWTVDKTDLAAHERFLERARLQPS